MSLVSIARPIKKNKLNSADAQIIHPNSGEWRCKGTVLKDGRQSSVIEVARLDVGVFPTKEEAEAHGLDLRKRWVDQQAGKLK